MWLHRETNTHWATSDYTNDWFPRCRHLHQHASHLFLKSKLSSFCPLLRCHEGEILEAHQIQATGEVLSTIDHDAFNFSIFLSCFKYVTNHLHGLAIDGVLSFWEVDLYLQQAWVWLSHTPYCSFFVLEAFRSIWRNCNSFLRLGENGICKCILLLIRSIRIKWHVLEMVVGFIISCCMRVVITVLLLPFLVPFWFSSSWILIMCIEYAWINFFLFVSNCFLSILLKFIKS